jgi:hypothetical protein
MSWAKKIPLGSPKNDFRDSGQGAVPPANGSLKRTLGWTESEYQAGPDRIVKSKNLGDLDAEDSSQKEQSRKGGTTSHRESPSQRPERRARRGSVLFTRTREEGKPLLALHPSTNTDDYRVVTFFDEATRQKEMIDAAHSILRCAQ